MRGTDTNPEAYNTRYYIGESEVSKETFDALDALRQQLAECERERDEWNELAKGIDTQLRTELAALTKERNQYKELHQAVTDANITLCQEKAALNDLVQGQAIDIQDYKDEIDRIAKDADEQAQTLHDTICSANRLSEQLAIVTKERDELVEAVLAVCCDPEGRVVIRGSDGDRAVLQAALAKLGADKREM